MAPKCKGPPDKGAAEMLANALGTQLFTRIKVSDLQHEVLIKRKFQVPGVVQGQHRVVSPGDVTKTPHCHCCSGLTLFLAFAVHLTALAGSEADLAVWVFLRATKTR